MNARKELVADLRDEFVEWLEGDDDVSELLMDKIGAFLEDKATYLSEDGRFDIGMEMLSDLAIR